MQMKSPDELMQLSNMKESVEALLPYTGEQMFLLVLPQFSNPSKG